MNRIAISSFALSLVFAAGGWTAEPKASAQSDFPIGIPEAKEVPRSTDLQGRQKCGGRNVSVCNGFRRCGVFRFRHKRRGCFRNTVIGTQETGDSMSSPAKSHNEQGLALAAQGRLDEALAEFQKALQIKPDYAEAYLNLGNALVRRGRVDEAIALFRKALEIKPNYAEAHNDLGMVLAASARIDEAISHFRKALEIKPEFKAAKKNLDAALIRRKGS